MNDSKFSLTSEEKQQDYYFGNGYSVLNCDWDSPERAKPLYQREGYVNWMTEFNKKNDYLAAYHTEVNAKDFYMDIFPPDTIEARNGNNKPCPIISTTVYKNNKSYVMNTTVFNDYKALDKADRNDFALCSMITFSGKNKTAKNGYRCHGFCIDLDGVDLKHLEILFLGIEQDIIPRPTYIANSGHGVHCYYVFENPIPLYPKVIRGLQKLKKGLTYEVWTRETSTYNPKDRQFQGIYQNFRMVGSKSKLAYDKKNRRYRNTKQYIIRAFQVGDKVDITYLNHFVAEQYRMDCSDNDWASYCTPEITPIREAKELWPDWYEKRVVQKLPKGHYKCTDGLYKWWLDKILDIAKDGNRYWCIAFLYVYGIKCSIPIEWVDEDAYSLVSALDEKTVHEDNSFTIDDVKAARQMYKQDSIDCPIRFIEEKCGIYIARQRRNGRKQSVHMKLISAQRDILYPNGEWRNMKGRPDKKTMVQEWRKAHPDGKKADCIRELGLTKPTVYKWW